MRNKVMTFRKWLTIAKASKNVNDLDLKKFTRPQMVGDVDTPPNLEEMTLGQMVELQQCNDGWKMFYEVCRVLLGMDEKEVEQAPATQVVRFVGWTIAEIDKLNKLFQSFKPSYTSEQQKAGYAKLDFGVFGLIDWYAQRMRITDHEEAMNVPALRVYQCLKMDYEKQQCDERLAKIYSEGRK